MPSPTFFPARPEVHPSIYAYRDKNPDHAHFLKVGYTEIDVERRVAQQFPVIQPGEGKPYEIVFAESAMRTDGSSFMDHAVHKRLAANGFANVGGEWFRCTPADVRNAWLQVRDRTSYERERTEDFAMRPEQLDAVNKTEAYFRACEQPGNRSVPKFLWNAKMRFGKTFATYQLARRMNMKRVLVLTFKPAVEDAWREDLESHIDFEGWQFVSRGAMAYEECDPARPIVCFGSFQDFLGVDRATGAIKPRNEWVHLEHWDLVAFDEYHFGAWRDSAQKLFAKPADEDDVVESTEKEVDAASTGNSLDETWLPIQADRYLYLSGTPFRALTSGEFIEDQIFNWTYSDEQQAKQDWVQAHPFEPNPYAALPRMVLMTYKVPDSITRVARAGEFDEFDLNVFFSATGEGAEAQFKYKDYVQKWLDLIRGALAETTTDELKMGAQKPVLPFSHAALLANLTHTLWFLPNVASCHAMANLLAERQNAFYHDYRVLIAAGSDAGIGLEAVDPVRRAMGNPLTTKTITLSCGKLTTGVTIRPWTGVFMLRNLKSPETYFQTAFRVQSPWTAKDEDGRTQVIKQECYVFDFALDRALAMVSDYSCQLSVDEPNPEKKVADFIKFLPVLAYDGSAMREVNAADILDIAMAGTSATLLARRWESALLVNVDNDTLRRLLDNAEAMRALSNIEGFRSLNDDIETIINKSEHVKKVKKEGGELSKKEKKELSEEEKEFKSKRKQIQEKLIKFATRIPVFMYLTDYREQSLKEVITQLEPGLFKKVTGLSVKDFELLVSLGVFRDSVMNDAVYKFRRYEDASLSYTGIEKHSYDARVGLFDTSLTKEDFEEMARQDTLLDETGRLVRAAAGNESTEERNRPRSGAARPAAPSRPVHGPGAAAHVRAATSSAGSAGVDARPHGVTASHGAPASSDAAAHGAEAAHGARRDWVVEALEERGLTYTDLRETNRGNLWVIGGGELDDAMTALAERGARFEFTFRGSQATRGRAGWWLAGYPEERKLDWHEPPAVTDAKLDALEPGDTVFHKAFGYGEVIDIDREGGFIEVVLGTDKHGRPKRRKFLFPNAFDQGLLTL
ncbi:GIY-YIG nuclease family protein [Collinsella sp. D33t1_170424_A12]|uniref:GIY-YIG nuclease family protein n=1 Tax=Collinsella sp. D33t1_170424_A12 TaxID=2787135 RepID=UPI0018983AE7|nr:GIY-YIG nuclease family protein [Collinsella sp. D33t1_170424_A12]